MLAFTRGDTVLCVFNLSPETHRVRLTRRRRDGAGRGRRARADGTLTLHPNGFAIMEASADVAVSDVPARRDRVTLSA